MGGPQVNGLQLLAAGQLDVVMADALQVLSAAEQSVPITAIAATFQKNPTVIIAHPGVAKLEDLKGKPIAVGAASNTTFWPWLKQRYGFTDDQKRPYAFSVQPFLVDPKLSQQGFATSEPFSIEKAGVKPVVFLLAEQGYPPYSEVLAVHARHAREARRRAGAIRPRVRGRVEELSRESGAGQRAHQARQSADVGRAARLRPPQDARVRDRHRHRHRDRRPADDDRMRAGSRRSTSCAAQDSRKPNVDYAIGVHAVDRARREGPALTRRPPRRGAERVPSSRSPAPKRPIRTARGARAGRSRRSIAANS